jgi:hypothetical protein
MFNDRNIVGLGNIVLMPPTAVVCVAVGDNAFIHRAPCINVNIGFFTINSFFVKDEQWLFHFSFSSSLKIRKGCFAWVSIKKSLG